MVVQVKDIAEISESKKIKKRKSEAVEETVELSENPAKKKKQGYKYFKLSSSLIDFPKQDRFLFLKKRF